MVFPSLRRSAAALVGALLLAGCADDAPTTSSMATTVTESVATVEWVDPAARQAVLVDDAGDRLAVSVDPAAGPLDKVSPGDLVQVVVVDRAVARLASSKDLDDAALAASVVGRRDGLPARDGLLASRRIVEIVDVTAPGDTVSYRDGDGQVQTVAVRNPDNKAFARSLSRGDRVAIDIVTTVTISTIGNT